MTKKEHLKELLLIVLSFIMGSLITILILKYNLIDIGSHTIIKDGTQIYEKTSLAPSVDKIKDAVLEILCLENKEAKNNGTGFVYKVDEKYAYVLDNALYAYPEKNTILLLEGNGMKDGVRKYFDRILNDGFPKGHRMYAKSKYVRMHMKEEGISFKVNSLSQFIDWFHHEMTA